VSGSNTGDLHRTVRARLADAAQSYTTNRRSIVDELALRGPCTLPELLDHRPDLAQSSAYRNLAVLQAVGVVRRLVHHGEFARYELAEELTGHHHHLVCTGCGTVADVEFPPGLERGMDEAFSAAARAAGFDVEHHVVDVYGRCRDCRG
jgi:Fe2+ or Zn2+ uptake regulation protein